ncbi:MAG: magnesium transporter [Rhodobacteraceae bacterium]|nr:magnesium transporter [Paracoccaceae bacterium]
MVEKSTEQNSAQGLSSEFVSTVINAIEYGKKDQFLELIGELHEADVADLIEQITPEQRAALISIWGQNFDFDVVGELDEKIRDEVVALIPPNKIVSSVGEMESDEIVDIVEDLEPEQKNRIINALPEPDQAAVEMAFRYPEDTAGRIMQRRMVMAPEGARVGQTIDQLRQNHNLPDDFYHIIIVNPVMKPIGQVPLGRLMASQRDVELSMIADEDFRTIPDHQDQHDVAYAFNQYHLISAPVTNSSGQLVGVITIDDAMNVLDEEAEEDLLRLGGVSDESLTDRVWGITKQRFPWLIVNLFTAILASIVIYHFSSTIEAIVALAVLMPIVASMGGNAGTQSLTVAVRAIATKDLTDSNSWRVIKREGLVGLINGLIFALIIGSVGYFWYGYQALGVVLGAAMIITMLVAGLSGILIPLGLKKVKVDPAVASSVFVTTLTDVVGFLAFLGLAAVILL